MLYLTFQIVLTERKTSLITVFPQLKKKWQRMLETFESEKGKVVSSNFQERFNREKARKTRMKIILSASR